MHIVQLTELPAQWSTPYCASQCAAENNLRLCIGRDPENSRESPKWPEHTKITELGRYFNRDRIYSCVSCFWPVGYISACIVRDQ